jgi:hypothetical protein
MIYALGVAAWDFCLGFALLIAAPVFSGDRRSRWVRLGMAISGVLCLGGLFGAVLGNMSVRSIGIVGYALVLPVVMLRMGQLFAATPAADDGAVSRPRSVESVRSDSSSRCVEGRCGR